MRYLKTVVLVLAIVLVWTASITETFHPGAVSTVMSTVSDVMYGGQDDDIVDIFDNAIPLGLTGFERGKSANGWLRIQDGQLVNSQGDPFQMCGMSSHGIAWFADYTNYPAIKTTKANGANMFRVVMYVGSSNNTYTTDPADQAKNMQTMLSAVANTTFLDMYAIVDWCVEELANPLDRVGDAVEFFGQLSARFKDEPGVIYEIASGIAADVSWDDVRAYADQVIPAIRENSPNAMIIVGTPDRSTHLEEAIRAPLPYENILYAYNFVTSDARRDYEQELATAKLSKLPVIVSEWSVYVQTGTLAEQVARAEEFLRYVNAHGISWANWALTNNGDDSAAIRAGNVKNSNWSLDDLTESGRLAFQTLKAA